MTHEEYWEKIQPMKKEQLLDFFQAERTRQTGKRGDHRRQWERATKPQIRGLLLHFHAEENAN